MPFSLNRRHFLGLSAGGLLLPSSGLAAPLPYLPERKFLFVFCQGGWDPSYALAPMFDRPYVDTEDDATTGAVGDLSFVDHADRPSVRAFFEDNAWRSALINGFEVESITHERCFRQLLTGGGDSFRDDWGAHLAARSVNQLLLPYMVLSGSAFTTEHGAQVVRSGSTGQLAQLFDGTAITTHADLPATLPSDQAAALVQAQLQQRVGRFGQGAGRGRQTRIAEHYGTALSQVDELRAMGDTLDLSGGTISSDELDQYQSMGQALSFLSLGTSRCAMVSYLGEFAAGWDNHSAIEKQSVHFEQLFQHLQQLMLDLDETPGPSGGSLAEEVTVVVISEMGRGPMRNEQGGKDHFTYTSALLIGDGVAGGRSVGDYDDTGVGRPIDLSEGVVSDSGTALKARHLGATLLAMGDVDPAEVLSDTEPIWALLA